MPLGCFSLFYWYADCKHITPHHNRKIITAVVFDCVRYGGGEESRTPVQKSIRTGVSERRHLFTFPYADAKRQASALSSSKAVTGAGARPCSRSPLK